MKKENLDRILFLCIGILFGGFLILLALLFIETNVSQEGNFEGENINIAESEQEIIENCSNLSLTNTSYCLVNNIKTFYIYNKTDDNLKLTFNQLKERGGDCRNYAFLYERLGKELNFNATTVRNNGVKGLYNAHRYAVLWDEETYCKLDLIKEVKCYKIDNDTE